MTVLSRRRLLMRFFGLVAAATTLDLAWPATAVRDEGMRIILVRGWVLRANDLV